MKTLLQEVEPAAVEDRSGRAYAVVMQGLEEGLNDDAIRSAAEADPSSVDKYGDRLVAEVDRTLNKERRHHKHVGKSCAAAGCTAANPTSETAEVGSITVVEMSWDQLWAGPLEPPRYLLEPLLPEGRTTTIFSPPKVGKSLLGLEIAAVLATGGVCGRQDRGDHPDLRGLDAARGH